MNYLLELHQPPGGATAKAMFAGHDIYRDGLIFGIVIDDILYLEADAVTRGEFEERGLAPFTYESKSTGKPVVPATPMHGGSARPRVADGGSGEAWGRARHREEQRC